MAVTPLPFFLPFFFPPFVPTDERLAGISLKSVRKKARLVKLIETYELKSHTKGNAAGGARSEAAMSLDKAHALLQRACEYSNDVVQSQIHPSLGHGEDDNDGISL